MAAFDSEVQIIGTIRETILQDGDNYDDGWYQHICP